MARFASVPLHTSAAELTAAARRLTPAQRAEALADTRRDLREVRTAVRRVKADLDSAKNDRTRDRVAAILRERTGRVATLEAWEAALEAARNR